MKSGARNSRWKEDAGAANVSPAACRNQQRKPSFPGLKIFFCWTQPRDIFGTGFEYNNLRRVRKQKITITMEGKKMKGYYTANGFYGLVGQVYVLFSDETDYYEYMEDAA